MEISIVKELRDRTSISLGKCKQALEESDGDIETAIVLLKKWGELKAAKAATAEAINGRIHSYIHHNGKIACMVEINCQTDFSANTAEFKDFCEQICLQIVAMNPLYISKDEIPEVELSAQKEIFLAQVPEKVPSDRINAIVNGKLTKWYMTVCLLDQESVLVPGQTIEQLRAELVNKLSENIIIKKFIKWEITG